MPRPHCDEHNRKQEREKATLHKSPGALESKLSCLRLLVRAEQGECRMGDRSGFNVVFIKHYQRHRRNSAEPARHGRETMEGGDSRPGTLALYFVFCL